MRRKRGHLRLVGEEPPPGLAGLQARLRLWWNGGEPPPSNVVSGEWAEAYLAMRASLRRSWVFLAPMALLIVLISGLIMADPYWPVFLFLFILLWFILPKFEEPATFLWHASIMAWLILYNVLVQFLSVSILIRVFWAAIVVWQAYEIYRMIRAYQQFRVFYTLRDTRSRNFIVPRLMWWGWAIGAGMALLTAGLLGVYFMLEPMDLLFSLGFYVSATAPAFALASLGVPDIRKGWAIPGAVASLIVTVGLYGLTTYTLFAG